MHSIPLERRLKLPDPGKVLEGAWKLLRRTRQRLETAPEARPVERGVSAEVRSDKKRARLEAERYRARGLSYALRTVIK